jgi:hypothetical protein
MGSVYVGSVAAFKYHARSIERKQLKAVGVRRVHEQCTSRTSGDIHASVSGTAARSAVCY